MTMKKYSTLPRRLELELFSIFPWTNGNKDIFLIIPSQARDKSL